MKKTTAISIIALLGLCVGGVLYSSRFPYTVSQSMCLKCRSIETTTTRTSGRTTEIISGGFADWFAQKFGSHEHVWGWSGSEKTYETLSLIRGCGSQNPIWMLPEDIQKDYYEKRSISELMQFWKILEGTDQERKDKLIDEIINEFLNTKIKTANKAVEPTTIHVTNCADAHFAPCMVAAHF